MIAREIRSYYDRGQEAERLSKGIGPLEQARSQELIQRFIPRPPAVVLDIGGGPGFYSAWLARQGYEVHHRDPVPLHVQQAKEASISQPETPIASCTVGDACQLEFPDNSADFALLLGPLYHLTERQDRLQALREAQRVLRPGGTLLSATITPYTSTHVGLIQGWIYDPNYLKMIELELDDGQHRAPDAWPDLFTTAYFHHLDEIQPEIEDAGLIFHEIIAIEGPVWLAKDFVMEWTNPEHRQVLLYLARRLEKEVAGYSMSPHIMAVAKKAI